MSFQEPGYFEMLITQMFGYYLFGYGYEKFADWLNLKGNEKIIDYGSGAGKLAKHIAARLRKNNGSLTCVDKSNRWHRIAKWNLKNYPNVTLKLGALDEIVLADNAYDAIVIHFVLHHVEKEARQSNLKILVSKLKHNGRIFIREPMQEHGHGITAAEISTLMNGAGLKQLDLKKHYLFTVGPVYDGVFIKP
jgi:ubiquinone/menaquinone biosynthesis C-methylase UbiE